MLRHKRYTAYYLLSLCSIVSSACEYVQTVVLYAIDEAIGIVDTATPTAGEIFAEWFGFSDSLERISLNVLE